MKQTLKKLVVAVLVRQVKALRKKNQFKIIGVAGSIGKTSTKLAIAQTLSKSLRVQYQEGNYNDIVSVPLIFFGQEMPSLFNPVAWLRIIIANQQQLKRSYPYDIVIVELGTDAPGQIAAFKKYLELDLAVVTAIAQEHMVNFGDLSRVAQEELSVVSYSRKILYNADYIDEQFKSMLPADAISYSLNNTENTYHIANLYHSYNGYEGDVKTGGQIYAHFMQEVVSETQLYSMLAAVIAGKELGLKTTQILEGLSAIRPVSGRLRRLRGINSSVIIDDTYNASPEAVKAGLKLLYTLEAPQKVAILGSMNELGAMSAAAHKEIGELCDPNQLGLVVTIGSDANSYLAPAAEAKGVNVQKFASPYEAGEYLQHKIEPGAVILAKGSQNGVFAEEVVKQILLDPEDANKLVRQSPYWLKKKQQLFQRT